MPTKLATPLPIKTRIGAVLATHVFHNIQIVDRPDFRRILSTVNYGVEVDGVVQDIGDGGEQTVITGADLDALGSDFTVATITTKHAEIAERNKAEAIVRAAEEAKRLETELAAASGALADAKQKLTDLAELPAPVVTIGVADPAAVKS